MITKYFIDFEIVLENYKHIVESRTINTQIFSEEKGLIEGELVFIDGSLMSFLEVVDIHKKQKNKYKYHYMTIEKELIFRYDNAQHHKGLINFPHHKHIGNEILDSLEVDFETVLKEIERSVSNV